MTSFQNQPFVPSIDTSEETTPAGLSQGLEIETASFENLADLPDEDEEAAVTADTDSEAIATDDLEEEDCVAAIAQRTNTTVEIDSTCPVPPSSEGLN